MSSCDNQGNNEKPWIGPFHVTYDWSVDFITKVTAMSATFDSLAAIQASIQAAELPSSVTMRGRLVRKRILS